MKVEMSKVQKKEREGKAHERNVQKKRRATSKKRNVTGCPKQNTRCAFPPPPFPPCVQTRFLTGCALSLSRLVSKYHYLRFFTMRAFYGNYGIIQYLTIVITQTSGLNKMLWMSALYSMECSTCCINHQGEGVGGKRKPKHKPPGWKLLSLGPWGFPVFKQHP